MSVWKDREKKFIAEYVRTLDGQKSAIAAGYSKKWASQTATGILRRPGVRERVDKLLREITEHHGITAQYIVGALREVADRCLQAVPVLDKEGLPTGEWKFDSTGANRALELLGKYRQLFVEKSEHSLTITLESLVSGSLPDPGGRPAAAVETTATDTTKNLRRGLKPGTAPKHEPILNGELVELVPPSETMTDNSKLSEVSADDKSKLAVAPTPPPKKKYRQWKGPSVHGRTLAGELPA